MAVARAAVVAVEFFAFVDFVLGSAFSFVAQGQYGGQAFVGYGSVLGQSRRA